MKTEVPEKNTGALERSTQKPSVPNTSANDD